MKKMMILLSISASLVLPVSGLAADMPGKMGGGVDERDELKLPPAMKVKQKRMMRKHMDTVSEITGLLAAGNLKGAAEISRDRLGWSKEEEKKCSNVSNMTGQPDFLSFGMTLHTKADELADLADRGDQAGAMRALSELISRCNDCHKRFRH